MSNSQDQDSRPTRNIMSSHEEDGFTVTISRPALVVAPTPSLTYQDDGFIVTISGHKSSSALSLGGDVTQVAPSRGRHASRPALAGGERHILIDFSNISISAMNHCGGRSVSNNNVRINIRQLTKLLADGRSVGTRYVAGSIPSRGKVPSYGAEFKQIGYIAEWLSRDHRTGTEKGVDSCLHAVGQQIVLDKLQKSGSTQSTETLVLVTGDGNAHTGLTSFPRLAESAADSGLRTPSRDLELAGNA